ncbi:type II secretion system protein [Hydrogenimonas sp.]
MRRGFTLIEIIMVISISGILAVGTFKALGALYIRSAKAQAVTELSLSSQSALDQIGAVLYTRVPGSVIGYDPSDGSFGELGSIVSPKPVLEWIGSAQESLKMRDYSGFIDMNASDSLLNVLVSPQSDGSRVNASLRLKFNTAADVFAADLVRLVFAGSYDLGAIDGTPFSAAFGWHGGSADRIYSISMSGDGNITLAANPPYIYEKYYLADTAYAVSRGADVNLSAPCIASLGIPLNESALLLFYDYRPWKGETFCADSGASAAGTVTLLAEDVAGFRAEKVNGTIRLSIDMLRPVRGSTPVHISKQKAVF